MEKRLCFGPAMVVNKYTGNGGIQDHFPVWITRRHHDSSSHRKERVNERMCWNAYISMFLSWSFGVGSNKADRTSVIMVWCSRISLAIIAKPRTHMPSYVPYNNQRSSRKQKAQTVHVSYMRVIVRLSLCHSEDVIVLRAYISRTRYCDTLQPLNVCTINPVLSSDRWAGINSSARINDYQSEHRRAAPHNSEVAFLLGERCDTVTGTRPLSQPGDQGSSAVHKLRPSCTQPTDPCHKTETETQNCRYQVRLSHNTTQHNTTHTNMTETSVIEYGNKKSYLEKRRRRASQPGAMRREVMDAVIDNVEANPLYRFSSCSNLSIPKDDDTAATSFTSFNSLPGVNDDANLEGGQNAVWGGGVSSAASAKRPGISRRWSDIKIMDRGHLMVQADSKSSRFLAE